MKQWFEQVDAGGSPTGGCQESGTRPTDTPTLPDGTAAAPAPAHGQGAWLSEALKLWCTDPHAPH